MANVHNHKYQDDCMAVRFVCVSVYVRVQIVTNINHSIPQIIGHLNTIILASSVHLKRVPQKEGFVRPIV